MNRLRESRLFGLRYSVGCGYSQGVSLVLRGSNEKPSNSVFLKIDVVVLYKSVL